MKQFRTLLAICFLCVASTVSAQFANHSSSANVAGGDAEVWDGLRVSYNNFGFDGDEGEDLDAINGIEVGYVKSYQITKNMPVFLETGVSLSYVFGEVLDESEEYYDGYDEYEYKYKLSYSMFSVIVPVNVGYKLALDEKLSVFPYFGLTFKGNITGTLEVDEEHPYYGEESGEYNVFDDDDMDDPYNRFQIGWQVGASLNYNNLNLGLSYGADIMELGKKLDTNSFKVTLGVNF